MLIIRLQRVGKKNQAYYRLVVAEKSKAASGKFLEILGSVNPHQKINQFKKERILHWIKNGAQTSDTVHNLFVKEKIIEGPKRKVVFRKKKKEGEETTTPNTPAATPTTPAVTNPETTAPETSPNTETAKEIKETPTEKTPTEK
jgi:small subunit ribosomal protein S16